MSYFATLDGAPAGDVATNSGWRDFSRWVSELENVDELRHLTEYGWSNSLDRLDNQLRVAMEQGDPSNDQLSIGHGLRKLLRSDAAKQSDVLVITDGVGAGGIDDAS